MRSLSRARRTLALVVAGGLAASVAMAATATRDLERTFPLGPGGRIHVRNIHGNVRVDTWDRPEVRLVIHKVAHAGRQKWAEEALENARVRITHHPRRILVETVKPEQVGLFSWVTGGPAETRIDYDVLVPARSGIVLETVHGQIVIEHADGWVEATSVHGNVHLSDVTGRVNASTVHGNVSLRLARVDAAAEIETTTVNGNILLQLPAAARAHLDARTIHGCVATELALDDIGKRSRSRLIGRLNEGGGTIKLRTTNGSVMVQDLPN